jgi:hypothetical protein
MYLFDFNFFGCMTPLSYSSCQKLSNVMLHALVGNHLAHVFWFFVVMGQIIDLNPNLSFGHNF